MSHTPAPWTIRGDTIRDKRYETIAQILKQSNDFPFKETPEADANARLIAAAPDMFVALQEMLSMFKDHRDYGDDEATAVKLALAAINLATEQ